MSEAIGAVLPLAIGIAISPISIIAVTRVEATGSPRVGEAAS